MGQRTRRRSISASNGTICSTGCGMAAFLFCYRYGLWHPEHAGLPVEPQPPKASRDGLARIRELPRKRDASYVESAAEQSCDLFGIATLHAQWSAIRHMLNIGQSRG